MNSQFPERYGGSGASSVAGVLIGEELAWGCAAIATTLGTNELAAAPVLLGGSEQIKAKYLGRLTEEPKLAAFSLGQLLSLPPSMRSSGSSSVFRSPCTRRSSS